MDADSDLKDPRSSAFIRGAFAFFLFDSRFASDVPSRFLAVDRPSARVSILNFAVLRPLLGQMPAFRLRLFSTHLPALRILCPLGGFKRFAKPTNVRGRLALPEVYGAMPAAIGQTAATAPCMETI
ncbi:MAG TPA: hypothetical protein VHY20_06295 [Pirellulales bacterium]|nr:hypothetical protein [Pirellulales bacterium]